MRRLVILAIVVSAAGSGACSGGPGSYAADPGSRVTLETTDGTRVEGRLVEIRRDDLLVETPDGQRTRIARRIIARLTAFGDRADPPGLPAGAGTAPGVSEGVSASEPSSIAPAEPRAPEYRQVRVPAGTVLRLRLETPIASDVNRADDPVRAVLRRTIRVDGVDVLPAGTAVIGHVTAAERSGRVTGRAQVAFRFTAVEAQGGRIPIRTPGISRVAPATKKADAMKIGGSAAGGALAGGILGGGDGVAKGAALGGAAGTGVVLATRGEEVRIGAGTPLAVKLADPVALRVPAR